ncbi:MAG: hypothetical protein BTN85_1317 [Candidatus Methanohalarchaeum thermophilum]|uniref:Uncharacterized protein n=1 Tax=Methanohalarchaeum thermophilum TaxID=1903181 RepID=A0A1Q6DWR8_METT1|nr:MAG: hypothetical protein BTN85_1317 [Candidatus Methanohalarchaeum thermophilum]
MNKKTIIILFVLIVVALAGIYYINNTTFNFSSSWAKNSMEEAETVYNGSISVKESRKMPGVKINVNATNRIIIDTQRPSGGKRGFVGVTATTPGIGRGGLFLNPVSRMNNSERITYFWENLFRDIPTEPLEESVWKAGIIPKDWLNVADVHNLELTKISKIKEVEFGEEEISPQKIHVFECRFELRGVKEDILVSMGKTNHQGDIIIGVTLTKPLGDYNISRQFDGFIFEHPIEKPE